MVNCHFPLWAQTNHILEQISISPLEWYAAQWKAQSRRYPIPFRGLLHLGVDKDILCPGIKRNDSMTVDLSGWRCFYLSPNFQYFPIVHKIIIHVAFSDPSQTHTASPNSISQLTASCLPLDPLFSPRNSSTLFPLCWACAFYWLLFSFLTPVPVRMPPPQALWNVLHCFPVCTVRVHISPQCLHAKPSLLCVPFPPSALSSSSGKDRQGWTTVRSAGKWAEWHDQTLKASVSICAKWVNVNFFLEWLEGSSVGACRKQRAWQVVSIQWTAAVSSSGTRSSTEIQFCPDRSTSFYVSHSSSVIPLSTLHQELGIHVLPVPISACLFPPLHPAHPE